jgi:hypothetical protein
MFIYNRGCVNNISKESIIEKFENTVVSQKFSEIEDKVEISSLKSGGSYELSIEKLEDNSEFEGGKITLESTSDNKVLLLLTYDSIIEDETTENTLTLELTLANKDEGIYTIDKSPRRFIKCYKEKENDKIYYFVIWKFIPSLETESFNLSNMTKDEINKFTAEKKLEPYMIIKLEHKPSYLLLIFLLIFFIVLGVVIYLILK